MPDLYNEDMPGRYGDSSKFITDPDKLELVNGTEVYISAEEDYDIVVDLKGQAEQFDALRPFIVFVAKNVCRLDDLVQQFDTARHGSKRFPYSLKLVFADRPHLILEYWGMEEGTAFDVVFCCKENRFVLESFGTWLNLPPDWSVAFA